MRNVVPSGMAGLHRGCRLEINSLDHQAAMSRSVR